MKSWRLSVQAEWARPIAPDPRLNRDVAIKVSAAQFSECFERKAKAIAALNHPNICQIYDVGPNHLVMEFIEGESPRGRYRSMKLCASGARLRMLSKPRTTRASRIAI